MTDSAEINAFCPPSNEPLVQLDHPSELARPHLSLGALLAVAYRQGLPETLHTGWALMSDSQGQVLWETPGASQQSSFFRSAAKPFQAMPLTSSLGGTSSLSSEALQELAVVCASHTGTLEHATRVESILKGAGLEESFLRCGPHWPLDQDTRRECIQAGQVPRPRHNNCSGKHAGMLSVCVHHQWPLENYWHADHPLQQLILQVIQDWGDLQIPPDIGTDGCGVPTYYLPLQTMAMMYARLVVDSRSVPLVSAMTTFPWMAGGKGRIDSALMESSQGEVLAKVGAEGLLAMGHRPSGRGLVLKMADGGSEIRNLVALTLLEKNGWLRPEQVNHPALALFREQQIRRNTLGEQVGEIRLLEGFDERNGYS